MLPGVVAEFAAPEVSSIRPAVPVPAEGKDPALRMMLPAVADPTVDVVSPAESVMLPAVAEVVVDPPAMVTEPPGDDDPPEVPAEIEIGPPPIVVVPVAATREIPLPVAVVPLVEPLRARDVTVDAMEGFDIVETWRVPDTTASPPKAETPELDPEDPETKK